MNTERRAVQWERRGHIADVRLVRTDKRNAMGSAFWRELPEVFAEIAADDEVRAVVLAADGKDFTVGLDLMEMGGSLMDSRGGVAGRMKLRALVHELQAAITSVEACPVPVIAAVHGWCIGGGVDLITACDIRFASQDAKLSVRETRIAIVADLGTLQRLQKAIPKGHAAELVYTGRDVDAARCQRIGLYNDVFATREETVKHAVSVAEEIAANSPLAVRGSKQVMQYSADRTVAEGLEYVAQWNTAFLHSADLVEAMQAFGEKRPPVFRGE